MKRLVASGVDAAMVLVLLHRASSELSCVRDHSGAGKKGTALAVNFQTGMSGGASGETREDLFNARVEDAPTSFVVVHESGEVTQKISGVVDHLGR